MTSPATHPSTAALNAALVAVVEMSNDPRLPQAFADSLQHVARLLLGDVEPEPRGAGDETPAERFVRKAHELLDVELEAAGAPPRGPSPTSHPDANELDPVRACALECAAHWHIGSSLSDERYDAPRVVVAAMTFEAYLRGDRMTRSTATPLALEPPRRPGLLQDAALVVLIATARRRTHRRAAR